MECKNTDWSAKLAIFAIPYHFKINSMAESRKASIRRGKPSYFMTIVGVTLILFLLGIIGWLVINANKLANYFKEIPSGIGCGVLRLLPI